MLVEVVARGLIEQSSDTSKVVEKNDTPKSLGRPRVEVLTQKLLPTVEQLLTEDTQADPRVLTGKAYTRITGQSLRAILADSLCIPISDLPTPSTLRRVLNRNGYVLRSLRKTASTT